MLYGLGQHGIFLWQRLASALESLGVELYYEDDRLDDPDRIRFPLSRCATEWEKTFVIVSPWESEKMAARLIALEGQHGRNWLTWRDAVEQLTSGVSHLGVVNSQSATQRGTHLYYLFLCERRSRRQI